MAAGDTFDFPAERDSKVSVAEQAARELESLLHCREFDLMDSELPLRLVDGDLVDIEENNTIVAGRREVAREIEEITRWLAVEEVPGQNDPQPAAPEVELPSEEWKDYVDPPFALPVSERKQIIERLNDPDAED